MKKLSSSSSTGPGAINAKSAKRNVPSRDIKYDLSGGRNEEVRDDLQKSLSQMDLDARKEAAAASGSDSKGCDDPAWYSFLFCVNNDTTNDTHTLGTLDSESSLSVENSSKNDNGRQSPPRYDLSGGAASQSQTVVRSSSRSRVMNRFSSAATDAALLSSTLRDPLVVSSTARAKRHPPTKSSLSPSSYPPKPSTRLKEGAGSLDIMMELQLDEDLLKNAKGSKKKEKKGGFRKKIKGHKKSNSKSTTTEEKNTVSGIPTSPSRKKKAVDNLLVSDDEVNNSAGDEKSVISERSIFSFATESPSKNKKGWKKSPVSSPSRLGTMQTANKSLCITGPANGTFLNISSAADAEHPELSDTYSQFRVHDRGVEMVLSRIATSIPLYHWTNISNQSFKVGDISMSVSSEDLGLTSFSNLDLTSPSMRSSSEVSIDIPVDVTHVCSEPSSKGFLVR